MPGGTFRARTFLKCSNFSTFFTLNISTFFHPQLEGVKTNKGTKAGTRPLNTPWNNVTVDATVLGVVRC